MIADLRSALRHIDADPYDDWIATGHALKELGEPGNALFLEWSATSPKFDRADAERAWASFNPSNTSYRAIFAKAQANGWQNPGQAKSYGSGLAPINIANIQAQLQEVIDGAGRVAAYKTGISAAALMAKEFEPIRNVIAGYVVEGLTLLAGAPKLGKSWMALGWGHCVASGEPAFGTVAVEQGDVLYLALEDNERRLKKRLWKMGISNPPERLTLVTQWPDLDNGCIAEMETWANDVAKPMLIIVDVLNKVRPSSTRSETLYEADYRTLSGLHAFATARGIAIVVVHHTRKMDADDPFDTVSGSRGLTGAADTVLVLRREPGTGKPMLYGRGRDIEEIENAMMFDAYRGLWRVVGEAWNVAKTDERQQILDVLNASPSPMTPTQIADELGKERTNVQHLLGGLVNEGKVSKEGRGLYSPVHSVHSNHSLSERGEQSEQIFPLPGAGRSCAGPAIKTSNQANSM